MNFGGNMRSNYKSGLSLRPIIFGVLAGISCCFLLISLACFLFLSSKSLPEEFFEYLSLVVLAVSSFAAGFAAGFTAKSKGLVYGFFCGIFLSRFRRVLWIIVVGRREGGMPAAGPWHDGNGMLFAPGLLVGWDFAITWYSFSGEEGEAFSGLVVEKSLSSTDGKKIKR